MGTRQRPVQPDHAGGALRRSPDGLAHGAAAGFLWAVEPFGARAPLPPVLLYASVQAWGLHLPGLHGQEVEFDLLACQLLYRLGAWCGCGCGCGCGSAEPACLLRRAVPLNWNCRAVPVGRLELAGKGLVVAGAPARLGFAALSDLPPCWTRVRKDRQT